MQPARTIKVHSENLAGAVSLLGSTSLAFAGGVENVAAAAVFTVAELGLARYGHRTGGYSASAALFAAGDLTLAFSGAVEPGSALQLSLLGMAAAWTAGALRYPFARAAEKFGAPKLQKIAGALPAL